METTITKTILQQIGTGNVLAICGGKLSPIPDPDDDTRSIGVIMHAGSGYRVEVILDLGSDTYIVRRLFSRAGKTTVKAEVTGVYCDQVGDIAYKASCFRNVPFNAATGDFQ